MHPEFRISPLKVELLSMWPLLFQFHDIVNQGDTEELIGSIEPQLALSTTSSFVVDPKRGVRVNSARTTFDKYIGNDQNSAARRLTRRIRHITKLDPAGTPYLFASYTYGGTYDIHHDAVCEILLKRNWNILLTATWINSRFERKLQNSGREPQIDAQLLWFM